MRKTKHFKKCLSMVLSFFLTVGMLTACGTEKAKETANTTSSSEEEMDRTMEDAEGEDRELEKYLKEIAPEDKSKLLVDMGTGTKLDTESTVQDGDSGSMIVIRREKDSANNNEPDIGTMDGNIGNIYPGAILHADSKLVDGRPDVLPVNKTLARKPIEVSVDINGNTEDPIEISKIDKGTIDSAAQKQIDNWIKTGKSAAAKLIYHSSMAYSKEQLETELGIKGAADRYKVDMKACMKSEKKEMLVVYNQIYYTLRVPNQTASYLFDDAVTKKDLQNAQVTSKRPGLAEVTSVSYGRQIVIKLSTSNTAAEVEAAWNANVSGTGISNSNKYSSVMENTTYSVFAFGGRTDTAGKMLTTTNLKEVNQYIAADVDFKKGSAAVPLSYTTNFIDDGSQAFVSRTTEYVKTYTEKRDRVSYDIDTTKNYIVRSQGLYGRKVTGINSDGSFKLSGWECIKHAGNSDFSGTCSGRYVEFGYEFDITGGTDWPYSDVFWTTANGAASSIDIETGGGCRTAKIWIKVNGNQVFKDSNCSKHSSKFP